MLLLASRGQAIACILTALFAFTAGHQRNDLSASKLDSNGIYDDKTQLSRVLDYEKEYPSGARSKREDYGVYDDTFLGSPLGSLPATTESSDAFFHREPHGAPFLLAGGAPIGRAHENTTRAYSNRHQNVSDPVWTNHKTKRGMDPIVVLSLVIGISMLLIIITAVGLLVLLRSRCTLSPPEPTLITYHPHSNVMETSFTHADDDVTALSEGIANKEVDVRACANGNKNDSVTIGTERTAARNNDTTVIIENSSVPFAQLEQAVPSTHLNPSDEKVSIVRPRPRPSFAERRTQDAPHASTSSCTNRPRDKPPVKPSRGNRVSMSSYKPQFIESPDISRPVDNRDSPPISRPVVVRDSPVISRPVVMRKKSKIATANQSHDLRLNKCLSEGSTPQACGDNAEMSTMFAISGRPRGLSDIPNAVDTNSESPSERMAWRKSEMASGSPNPIDTLHKVLLSMDKAEEQAITPDPAKCMLGSYDIMGSVDDVTECINPLYLSNQTIDSRVASFLMRPNPSILCEQADFSAVTQQTACGQCDETCTHICDPEHCHYPVFFTQSCPNTPMFQRKKHDFSDINYIDEQHCDVDESNNNEYKQYQSAWSSETNLDLMNKLNGLNVFLRPAMRGEQLLNSQVCPSAWLMNPQCVDDRWEMRTTF